MTYSYIHHKECKYCKVIDPLVDKLIDSGWDLNKLEWSDQDTKTNHPTPCIFSEDFMFSAETLLSIILTFQALPDHFNFNSELDLLKYILKNNIIIPSPDE